MTSVGNKAGLNGEITGLSDAVFEVLLGTDG